MSTMQAEYKTDIARLAEDMAKRDADAYRRETEASKRETIRAWATIGTMIAVVSLATAIILAVD